MSFTVAWFHIYYRYILVSITYLALQCHWVKCINSLGAGARMEGCLLLGGSTPPLPHFKPSCYTFACAPSDSIILSLLKRSNFKRRMGGESAGWQPYLPHSLVAQALCWAKDIVASNTLRLSGFRTSVLGSATISNVILMEEALALYVAHIDACLLRPKFLLRCIYLMWLGDRDSIVDGVI